MLSYDGETWTSEARDQVPTRVGGDPAGIPGRVVEQLAEVAAAAIAAHGPARTVGIGVPGLYDPLTGTTRFLVNLPGPWAGHAVAEPVAEAVGLPVHLINDARAFGLAELRLGAGRGASSMIGFTLGTGVGGVIAIDGRVVQGHDGTAGELGHQTIEPDGPWCGCGNRGCLEAFARADQIAAACGTATAEEAVLRARGGDRRAVAGLAQVGRYLGIGIASMVTVITPDRVVIGGGIAVGADLLLPAIHEELQRRVKTTSLDRVEVVIAELGTWAGAIGATVHGAEAAAARDAERPRAAGVAGVAGVAG
jgi:glucokinase